MRIETLDREITRGKEQSEMKYWKYVILEEHNRGA
jgi:hypothetical protein